MSTDAGAVDNRRVRAEYPDRSRLAGVFADPDVVDAYRHRPPTIAAARFRQPVADYVEQFHSTASLARLHMSAAEAAEFDAAVTRLVRPWAVDGRLELAVDATVWWGRLRSA